MRTRIKRPLNNSVTELLERTRDALEREGKHRNAVAITKRVMGCECEREARRLIGLVVDID